MWLAAYSEGSGRLEGLLRAAETEPGNGEYWHRLGLLEQWNSDAPNPALAIQYYKRAVQIAPRSALYWMDLATVCEVTGDIAEAKKDFARAQADYPISADVSWKYGNFLLREGNLKKGLEQLRQALETDPELSTPAIATIWRATGDVNYLLNSALPPNLQDYFDALNFFAMNHELEAGLAVWDRLLSLGKPLRLENIFPFLDELIREERSEDAWRVWEQALDAAHLPRDSPANGSVVSDGGFEFPLANGGFGWRVRPVMGAIIDFDSTIFHSGRRSLRVDFDGGSNLDFGNVTQYVPVLPRTEYHFHAELRTEKISTESGMRFSILDPFHSGASNVMTDNLIGTHPWTLVEADLTTGEQTRILEIMLRRLPSRLFDNRLSGTAWVDDVSLTPVRPGKQSPQP